MKSSCANIGSFMKKELYIENPCFVLEYDIKQVHFFIESDSNQDNNIFTKMVIMRGLIKTKMKLKESRLKRIEREMLFILIK